MMLPLVFAAALTGGPAHAVSVRWERNFDEALKKARAARKPLIVDFWADWCGWCRRLDETTYADPGVMRLLEGFVTVNIDTEGGRHEAAVATRVMAWEAALERDPSDASAVAGLGVHLFEQEAYEEAYALLARAVAADAERPPGERKKTRLILAIMNNHRHHYERSETLLKEALGLRPAGPLDAKLLFVLSRAYIAEGREADARAALKELLASHAESPMAEKARETLVALDRNR